MLVNTWPWLFGMHALRCRCTSDRIRHPYTEMYSWPLFRRENSGDLFANAVFDTMHWNGPIRFTGNQERCIDNAVLFCRLHSSTSINNIGTFVSFLNFFGTQYPNHDFNEDKHPTEDNLLYGRSVWIYDLRDR